MRRVSLIAASIALPAMLLASAMPAGAAVLAQGGAAMGGGGDSICRVKVSRSASDGVFDLARQVLSNGKCVCRVTTGPRSQGGSAESALASLLLRRTCSDAPLVATTGAAAGGGLSTGLLIGAGALAAGGVAAAVSSGGSKSP